MNNYTKNSQTTRHKPADLIKQLSGKFWMYLVRKLNARFIIFDKSTNIRHRESCRFFVVFDRALHSINYLPYAVTSDVLFFR